MIAIHGVKVMGCVSRGFRSVLSGLFLLLVFIPDAAAQLSISREKLSQSESYLLGAYGLIDPGGCHYVLHNDSAAALCVVPSIETSDHLEPPKATSVTLESSSPVIHLGASQMSKEADPYPTILLQLLPYVYDDVDSISDVLPLGQFWLPNVQRTSLVKQGEEVRIGIRRVIGTLVLS